MEIEGRLYQLGKEQHEQCQGWKTVYTNKPKPVEPVHAVNDPKFKVEIKLQMHLENDLALAKFQMLIALHEAGLLTKEQFTAVHYGLNDWNIWSGNHSFKPSNE